MTESSNPNHPWMVAVWPGMGHVAINAGYYLMAKLGMTLESELDARELFEIGHVSVDRGIIRSGRLPRSRFFRWKNPDGQRDLIVFLGEAQPPTGIYAYCRRIISHARELGVRRVFTFAAMATEMTPDKPSRVFAAATNSEALKPCEDLQLEILQSGQISGLNGVLPSVADDAGLDGTCLLGEMPHVFAQMPYPRASLEVLKTFKTLAGINVDLSDLERETDAIQAQLETLMSKIQQAIRQQQGENTPSFATAPEEEPQKPAGPDPQDVRRINELFTRAEKDRSEAYKLKQELDRLKLFPKYEDRFLDLFATSDQPDEQEDHQS